MGKSLKLNGMLLLTSFIWGSAFVAQKLASGSVGVFTFNGLRYLISMLFLIPVIIVLDKFKDKNNVKVEANKEERIKERKNLITGGVLCGIILCIATNFQQLGVEGTNSGKAAFITSLYIVIVPILGLFLGKKVRGIVWGCVAVGVVGLYLLSIKPDFHEVGGWGFTLPFGLGNFSIGEGDFFILICAIVFSVHILVIDHFSPKVDGVKMSCIQFAVAGVISTALIPFFEDFHWADVAGIIAPLLYAGILSGGVAYTLQIVAQKDADPTIASLLLSMESVFGLLSGVIILGDTFTLRESLGCVLMLVAIVVSQIPEDFKIRKRKVLKNE